MMAIIRKEDQPADNLGNVYERTSNTMRPLAMRQLLDQTWEKLQPVIDAGDAEEVNRILLAAASRFVRLGGVDTLRAMDGEAPDGALR